MTLARAQRVLTVAATAALVVLALSGAWLTRYYRPEASFFSIGRRPRDVVVFVGVHRAATAVLVVSLAVLIGLRLVTSAMGAVWPALGVVAAVGLILTGRRIAWKLLALWAVTANFDTAGMVFAAFDDVVRFVIVPGVG